MPRLTPPSTRLRRSFLLILFLFVPVASHAQVAPEEFAARRATLAGEVGDGVILALGSAAPPQDYIAFFQNSPFRYLTGFTETDAALLMVVEGGAYVETLFVNPRDPATETWEGYRIGPEGVEGEFGLPGRSVEELPAVLDSVMGGRDVLHVVASYQPRAEILNHDTQRIRSLLGARAGVEVRPVTGLVNQMRQVKSEAERELLRRSIAITVAAHEEVLGALAPGRNEFEIQAVLEYTFRRNGSERPAFSSIVGSGPNSTILHYNANDRFMEDGDVVVVDIGAAYGGYAADITRTLPVNGRFSPAQRDIYQLVRDAQAAAEAAARPGAPRDRMSAEAVRVLAGGLTRLGLIERPDAVYDCESPAGMRECPQLTLYYMHGLGHGIGLDVHDPWPVELVPGTAFTIEPGVYVRPNLFDEVIPDTPRNRALRAATREAYERYRNIGVRIEDDYIVTEEGLEWVSQVPREIDEIEAAMAGNWAGPAPRNAEWVEWYRRMK